MSLIDYLLSGAIVLLVLLPPRFDPAIRLKEWVENHIIGGQD